MQAAFLKHPIHYAGLWCLACYSSWPFTSQSYAEITLSQFLIPALMAMAGIAVTWWVCHSKQLSPTIPQVWFWAIALRLVGLATYPILEDDMFRYLWDGYQTLSTGSPYTAPPSAFFGVDDIPEHYEDVLGAINYPDVPTIYAPVTQWMFAAAAWVAPAKIWPLQAMLMCADLAVIALLMKRAKPLYVWLFAVNPLVIKETVVTAHPDMLAIALLLFACTRPAKQWCFAAVICGLAVSAKIFAILLVPWCLGFRWRAWLVFVATVVAVLLPYWRDLLNLAGSVATMGEHWLFNSPFYLLVREFMPNVLTILKPLLLSVFVFWWCVVFYRYSGWFKHDRGAQLPRGDWVYMLFLLAVPVANPWYFLWVLPFAVVYPSLWGWVMSFAVLLSYVVGLNLPDSGLNNYQIPVWALCLEYGLIALAFVLERYWKRRQQFRQATST